MSRYLIHADVMIDVSRGNASAAPFVDSLDDITISIIIAHDLIVGARNQRDSAATDGLIQSLPLQADLRPEIAWLAYDLLRRHAKPDGLRRFDALIAATAIVEKCTLVSRNRKHFEKIRGLDYLGAGILTQPLRPIGNQSVQHGRL